MKKPILITGITAASIACLAVFFLIGSAIGANINTTRVKTSELPLTRENLLKLVNQERARHDVAPLTEDSRLDQSAQYKADDEVKYNYFGHVKPGMTGNNGLDYLNGLHTSCTYISENLVDNINSQTGVVSDNTATGSVNDWIASPAHHAAMIDPRYSLTGFGINGTQVVEHFCQTN